MSQEQKSSSVSSSSISSSSLPQDSKASDFKLPKALSLGDAKVAALLKPVKTTIHIKPRYRDTAFADEIFAEPYSSDTGDVYEWEQMTHWLKTHNTNPKTNEPLESKKLRPAKDKQEDVQEFLDEHPELRNSEEVYLPRHWVKELEQACEKGDVATIKRLCDRDKRLLCWKFNFNKEEGLVDPGDCERWRGKTILHLACRYGKPEAITQLVTLLEQYMPGLALHLLLEVDARGHLPLHHAILGEQSEQTLLMLRAWMADQLDKVAVPQDWTVSNKTEDISSLNCALGYCILKQDVVGIRFFLRLGANPDAVDQSESLVCLAAKAGLVESLKVLLAAKADPNWPSFLDGTPLYAAVRAGHLDVVRLLKEHGAKTEKTLENGSAAIHLAAEHRSPAILEALCEKDYDYYYYNHLPSLFEDDTIPAALREVPDAKGHTPLHRAIMAGSIEVVRWLLEQHASLDSRNAQERNALHLAAALGQTEILELLLKHGAAVNAQDHTGNTALHLAAALGNQMILATLLRAGSSQYIKNKEGRTARQCTADQAALATYDAVVAELREKEVEALKAHGPLGLMLAQQQELIRQQQAEIAALREDVAQLKETMAKLAPHSAPQKLPASGAGLRLFDEKKSSPPAPNPAQIKLQDDLVTACEKGDEKETSRLLKQGAKPDIANKKGKQPLGAAIWGMNQKVTRILLQAMGGTSSMSWEEWEQHNQKHYREVFLIKDFKPKTFEEWGDIVQKMKASPFVQASHLNVVHEENLNYSYSKETGWAEYSRWCNGGPHFRHRITDHPYHPIKERTGFNFKSYQTQIKMDIEVAFLTVVPAPGTIGSLY